MTNEPDPLLDAIRKGQLTGPEQAERIAERRRAIAEQAKREAEVARFAEERRNMIAEQGIDSRLQRWVDAEPEP